MTPLPRYLLFVLYYSARKCCFDVLCKQNIWHKTVQFYATCKCFPALIRCKGTTFFLNMQVTGKKMCIFLFTPCIYTRARMCAIVNKVYSVSKKRTFLWYTWVRSVDKYPNFLIFCRKAAEYLYNPKKSSIFARYFSFLYPFG